MWDHISSKSWPEHKQVKDKNRSIQREAILKSVETQNSDWASKWSKMPWPQQVLHQDKMRNLNAAFTAENSDISGSSKPAQQPVSQRLLPRQGVGDAVEFLDNISFSFCWKALQRFWSSKRCFNMLRNRNFDLKNALDRNLKVRSYLQSPGAYWEK